MGNLTAQKLAGHQKWKKKPKWGNVNVETDGNKKQLFWINSSSGDLFLVAPITFTAGDVVVLVVEARDASTTNALRDTTIVRVSFYGRGTS